MIAVAEPVVVGISEFSAERARRSSFAGRSTMVWEALRQKRVLLKGV